MKQIVQDSCCQIRIMIVTRIMIWKFKSLHLMNISHLKLCTDMFKDPHPDQGYIIHFYSSDKGFISFSSTIIYCKLKIFFNNNSQSHKKRKEYYVYLPRLDGLNNRRITHLNLFILLCQIQSNWHHVKEHYVLHIFNKLPWQKYVLLYNRHGAAVQSHNFILKAIANLIVRWASSFSVKMSNKSWVFWAKAKDLRSLTNNIK